MRRLIAVYYLATPIFLVLDFALGFNVRTSFLDEAPLLKVLYYVLAFGCGAAVAKRPQQAGLIGLVESGANIALLVLGTGLTYLRMLDDAASETVASQAAFGPPEVINLVLSATILAVSYIAAGSRVSRAKRDRAAMSTPADVE